MDDEIQDLQRDLVDFIERRDGWSVAECRAEEDKGRREDDPIEYYVMVDAEKKVTSSDYRADEGEVFR